MSPLHSFILLRGSCCSTFLLRYPLKTLKNPFLLVRVVAKCTQRVLCPFQVAARYLVEEQLLLTLFLSSPSPLFVQTILDLRLLLCQPIEIVVQIVFNKEIP